MREAGTGPSPPEVPRAPGSCVSPLVGAQRIAAIIVTLKPLPGAGPGGRSSLMISSLPVFFLPAVHLPLLSSPPPRKGRLCSEVSQPGLGLLTPWGTAALCFVGWSPASLPSTHWTPAAPFPPGPCIQELSRYCRIFPSWGWVGGTVAPG